jgi:hypothetical protein
MITTAPHARLLFQEPAPVTNIALKSQTPLKGNLRISTTLLEIIYEKFVLLIKILKKMRDLKFLISEVQPQI